MAGRDERWEVPDDYDVERDESRVLMRDRWGVLAGQPHARLATIRAFEERMNAADPRPVDRAIFSLAAGWPWKAKEHALALWARERPTAVEDRLLVAEVLALCDADAESEGVTPFEIIGDLWRERGGIEDAALVLRIGTGLAIETPRRHRDDTEGLDILERTAGVIERAPTLAGADFELHRAIQLRGYCIERESVAEARAFAAAFDGFASVGDSLGLAECALLEARRREERRPEELRAPLEYAVYRYKACGRPEWAASVICYKLAPLTIDEFGRSHVRVRECFEEAMQIIGYQRGPDDPTDNVLRMALRMQMSATLSAKGWQFVHGKGKRS